MTTRIEISYISRGEKQSILKLLYLRDGPQCCWCSTELLPLDSLPRVTDAILPHNYPTIEHMIKRANGGAHAPFNYRLSCPKCNAHRDQREAQAS